MGCQNRGGSEYLFMMWYSDGRKFWFYDQYVVFMGSGFPASVKRTGERLAKALKNWEGTSEDILYSGIGDRFWKKDELR